MTPFCSEKETVKVSKIKAYKTVSHKNLCKLHKTDTLRAATQLNNETNKIMQ